MNDVIAGHIQTVAVNALEVLPHVKSGKLRVLAVLSEKRSPIFPDAPTIAESGFPGFEASVWYGVVGPAGLPPAVVARCIRRYSARSRFRRCASGWPRRVATWRRGPRRCSPTSCEVSSSATRS